MQFGGTVFRFKLAYFCLFLTLTWENIECGERSPLSIQEDSIVPDKQRSDKSSKASLTASVGPARSQGAVGPREHVHRHTASVFLHQSYCRGVYMSPTLPKLNQPEHPWIV